MEVYVTRKEFEGVLKELQNLRRLQSFLTETFGSKFTEFQSERKRQASLNPQLGDVGEARTGRPYVDKVSYGGVGVDGNRTCVSNTDHIMELDPESDEYAEPSTPFVLSAWSLTNEAQLLSVGGIGSSGFWVSPVTPDVALEGNHDGKDIAEALRSNGDNYTKQTFHHHQKNCKVELEDETRIEDGSTVAGTHDADASPVPNLSEDDCDERNAKDHWDRESDDSYHPSMSPISSDESEIETEVEPSLPMSIAKSTVKGRENRIIKNSLVEEESNMATTKEMSKQTTDNAVNPAFPTSVQRPIKRHKCTQCGKGFYQRYELNRHILIHDENRPRPFKCGVCNKSFIERKSLISHNRTHTGEKQHTCTQCGKQFYEKGKLNRHILTHSGNRPRSFKCSHCTKSFIDPDSLRRHNRTHTGGEKPYGCSKCSSRFYRPFDLKRHMVSHTDQRNYKCSDCGARFKINKHLKRHQLYHCSVQKNRLAGEEEF